MSSDLKDAKEKLLGKIIKNIAFGENGILIEANGIRMLVNIENRLVINGEGNIKLKNTLACDIREKPIE